MLQCNTLSLHFLSDMRGGGGGRGGGEEGGGGGGGGGFLRASFRGLSPDTLQGSIDGFDGEPVTVPLGFFPADSRNASPSLRI